MPRYYRKNRITLKPLVENISERVQQADSRLRRTFLKYAIITFSIFVVYSFFAGPYGFFRINRLENRREELLLENRGLIVKLIDSDVTRQRLVSDPDYIEYIARTKYLLVRPGESLIRLRTTANKR